MKKLIKYTLGLLLLLIFSCKSDRDRMFLVFLNTNPDREELPEAQVKQLQEKHLEHISRLYDEGKIIAAGPFSGGGGIFIMQDKQIDSVRALLQTDAAIAANRFKLEVFPMQVTVGGICKLPDEYEMATYSLLRFWPDTEKPIYPEDYKIYPDSLWPDVNLLMRGELGAENGWVMVLDTDSLAIARRVFEQHPALVDGHYDGYFKQLWIARGTFCE